MLKFLNNFFNIIADILFWIAFLTPFFIVIDCYNLSKGRIPIFAKKHNNILVDETKTVYYNFVYKFILHHNPDGKDEAYILPIFISTDSYKKHGFKLF